MEYLNSFSSLIIITLTVSLLSINCQSEYVHPVLPQAAALVAESFTSETALPTVTVRGFLNFRTTVDGTVIVFTPASAAATGGPATETITPTSFPSSSRIEVTSSPPKVEIRPTLSSSRSFEVKPTSQFSSFSSINHQSLVSSEPVVNSGAQYPTGLVTVLGGTVVLNGATTVHETKVIGTYINGKYAQILKSTSHVSKSTTAEPTTVSNSWSTQIKPSTTLSVTPSVRPRPSRDSLKSESSESVRRVRPLRVGLELSKKEVKDEPKETEGGNTETAQNTENNVKLRRPTRIGTRLTYTPRENPRVRLNRFKVKLAASSTASPTSREKVEEEAAKEINQRFQKRLGIGRSGQSNLNNYRRSRNEAKPIGTPSPAPHDDENKDSEPQSLTSGSDHGSESSGSYAPPLFDQSDPLTGPLEPSIPIKQVQTVTSEITHHLNGSPVKVDTVTLVTTIDEAIHPSARLLLVGEEGGLIEPTEPLPLSGNDVTGGPNGLEATTPIVLSRTYSLTEHVSRTTVVPVFDGTASANHTITENFVIRKLITAYKTMPSGDSDLLATASAEMANGTALIDGLETSEKNLEPSLLGGSIELTALPDDIALIKHTSVLSSVGNLQTLDPSTGFGQNGPYNSPLGQNLPPFDLSNPLVVGAALRNPALAAMYLGLQNYHDQQPQYETITRPTEVISHETVYNTKVLSFYDGRATRTRTITEPASTIDKTVTTLTTQVTPRLNTVDVLAAAQAQQFQRLLATQLLQPNGPSFRASVHPNLPGNLNGFNGFNSLHNVQQPNFNGNNYHGGHQLSPQLQHAQSQQIQQQQNQQIANGLNQLAFGRFGQPQLNVEPASTLTHTYTTVTEATSTQSKIYTLKYNAFSTKYRTVTSTSVYPTTITTTSTVVVQPSLGPAFNPFFG